MFCWTIIKTRGFLTKSWEIQKPTLGINYTIYTLVEHAIIATSQLATFRTIGLEGRMRVILPGYKSGLSDWETMGNVIENMTFFLNVQIHMKMQIIITKWGHWGFCNVLRIAYFNKRIQIRVLSVSVLLCDQNKYMFQHMFMQIFRYEIFVFLMW